MELNEVFKKIKSAYIAIDPPVSLKEEGWLSLREKLPEPKAPRALGPRLSFWLARPALSLATVAFCFLLLISLNQVAEAALPGELFYPLKRFKENVLNKVAKSSSLETKRRAREVVGLVKKKSSEERVSKTVDEYRQSVKNLSREFKDQSAETGRQKAEELKEQLKDQEKQFNEVLEAGLPEAKKHLEAAIKTARETLAEIGSTPEKLPTEARPNSPEMPVPAPVDSNLPDLP